MDIQELQKRYAALPQVGALAKIVEDKSAKTVFLDGLLASSAPMAFGSLALKSSPIILFILQDADEAGYFYHDLTQIMGEEHVLFFPSSYRRAVKYGQRDAASEILRTEVLTKITSEFRTQSALYIVSHPEAVAELVVSRKRLDNNTITLKINADHDVDNLCDQLRKLGFHEVEYVYEPGQFALRGSILDVYSFSCEYPYRIDFFGDTIDSIRTFEVENQLSRDKRTEVDIVPELAGMIEDRVPLMSFLPKDTIIAMRDFVFVCDTVDRTFTEGFSQQAILERTEGATEMEQEEIKKSMRKEVQLTSGAEFVRDISGFRLIEMGHRSVRTPDATIRFNISPQPLFHKNFDILHQTLEDFTLRGYGIYILADSRKQNERLKEILLSEERRVKSEE